MSETDNRAEFERIAVIGPGLLGGSIARAIPSCLPAAELRVWGRREEPLESLRSENAATLASTDLDAVIAGADLIVLATPVGSMGQIAKQIAESTQLAADCVVTDVGSVKASVVAELEPVFANAGAHFVGSHPMAGSEKSGLDHATADLFQGAACLVTPTEISDRDAVERIEQFWQILGCRVSHLSPEEHDRAVALISHLPHVVAAVLVDAVLADSPELGKFAGGGFRDTTRIASGSPELWAEILTENHQAVVEASAHFLTKFGETLAFFDGEGKEGLHRWLSDAKKQRDTLAPPPLRFES